MKRRAASDSNMCMNKDMYRMPASFARTGARQCGSGFHRFGSKNKNISVSGTVFALAVPFFVFVRGIFILITAAVKKISAGITGIIRLISGAVGIRKDRRKCPNILKCEKCL